MAEREGEVPKRECDIAEGITFGRDRHGMTQEGVTDIRLHVEISSRESPPETSFKDTPSRDLRKRPSSKTNVRLSKTPVNATRL